MSDPKVQQVQFEVQLDLLHELLRLPGTSRIDDGWIRTHSRTLLLLVTDPSFPETSMPQQVNPTLTRHPAIPEQVEWNWNLPTNQGAHHAR